MPWGFHTGFNTLESIFVSATLLSEQFGSEDHRLHVCLLQGKNQYFHENNKDAWPYNTLCLILPSPMATNHYTILNANGRQLCAFHNDICGLYVCDCLYDQYRRMVGNANDSQKITIIQLQQKGTPYQM